MLNHDYLKMMRCCHSEPREIKHLSNGEVIFYAQKFSGKSVLSNKYFLYNNDISTLFHSSVKNVVQKVNHFNPIIFSHQT